LIFPIAPLSVLPLHKTSINLLRALRLRFGLLYLFPPFFFWRSIGERRTSPKKKNNAPIDIFIETVAEQMAGQVICRFLFPYFS
jgi:hypothetical protein